MVGSLDDWVGWAVGWLGIHMKCGGGWTELINYQLLS